MILRPPTPPTDFNFSCMPVPIIQAALNQSRAASLAPPGMILVCALAAAAIASQGLADVQLPIGSVRPLSLLCLIEADSGERKSVVFNHFFRSIQELEERFENECNAKSATYEEDLKIWSLKFGAIEKTIRRQTIKGESTAESEKALRQLSSEKPRPPKRVKIVYEDATSPALFHGMHEDLPFAALCSSEGISILNSAAFNDVAKQNAIWSGDSITIDRVSAPSFRLSNMRLTILMMLQPIALQTFQNTKGGETRGSGLWARFVVCRPGSTQGTRFITDGTISTEHIKRFQDRVEELLTNAIQNHTESNGERTILKFSAEAEKRWFECFNWVESQIAPNGIYFEARDHASKLMENIGRVAGILHVFEGFSGPISLETLNVAIFICEKSSNDFLSLFVPPAQEELDAMLLLEFLNKKRMAGYKYLRKNEVRLYGPNSLRNAERLGHAVSTLCQRGNISLYKSGRTTFINLCPYYLNFSNIPNIFSNNN